jgi:hypothetical protein
MKVDLNTPGDFDQFKDFVRKVVRVPHAEVQARLEAEKRKKTKPSVSPAASRSLRPISPK